jgi:tRNA pseudouridine55 synthase
VNCEAREATLGYDKFMKKEEKNFGFILIDKPVGPTSFGVIARLRRITGIKKIGHAGTLDPFASGLLLCAIGREATREIEKFVKLGKEYEADVFFGISTDTFDREGETTAEYSGQKIDKKKIKAAILSFLGKQKQTPPMFSAKKIGGKKLCDLARKGIEIERAPNDIEIFSIKILRLSWPRLKIRLSCSSGTYIRTIAADLGEQLGCGAHLTDLRRTKINGYSVKKAIRLDRLTRENWRKFLLV